MDWQNVIGDLPQEQQLELYQAIALYALKGEELELSSIAKVAFAFIKQTLDRDANKYEEIKKVRQAAGKKGGRAKKKETSEEEATLPPTEEKKPEKAQAVPFVPPTMQEVEAYCAERGNDISSVQFYNFYKAKGWKIGNQPMKDWRAAICSWEANKKERQQQAPLETLLSLLLPLSKKSL